MTVSSAREMPDISSNNPLPNVHEFFHAGYRHMCRKVTEGTDYHWLEGDALTDALHALGVHVGHYHWLRPDQDVVAQARAFVARVKPHLGRAASTFDPEPDGDWLMVDYEVTANAADPSPRVRARQLRLFISEVRRLLPGYLIAVYTGNWYLDGKPAMQAEVRNYPVVISGYQSTLPVNPYRLTFVAWQFTDRAWVAGFSAGVDCNRWLGTSTPKPTRPVGQPTALTVKAGSMYEVIQDASNGYWYAYALGMWVRIWHQSQLDAAVNSPLCVNRSYIHKKQPRGYQVSHGAVLARQNFALGSAK